MIKVSEGRRGPRVGRLRAAAVAIVALVLSAGAAAPRPIEEDEPAFWSEVALFKAGPGRPRPIVVVRRGEQPKAAGDITTFYQGLLAREIVRQGLILAAREELGATVRDVPIGDPGVEGKPDATCRIGSRFRTAHQAGPDDPAGGRITVVEGRGPMRKVLWAGELNCQMSVLAPTYPRLVFGVERLSREAFPEALRGLGLARAEPTLGGGPAPGRSLGGRPRRRHRLHRPARPPRREGWQV